MIRALFLLPLLAGCAPVPMTPERATRTCLAEIGQADGVSGSVGVGIGSTGPSTEGTVTVTNRVLAPQTESEFLSDCVARRVSGAPEPTVYGITVGDRRR